MGIPPVNTGHCQPGPSARAVGVPVQGRVTQYIRGDDAGMDRWRREGRSLGCVLLWSHRTCKKIQGTSSTSPLTRHQSRKLGDSPSLSFPGGYYLTSAYGALSLIKNFQEEQAARLLSSETRDTLRQWHKRRTTNRTIPSVDDFQVCGQQW